MTVSDLAAQLLQQRILKSGWPRSMFEEDKYVAEAKLLADIFLNGRKQEVEAPVNDQLSFDFHNSKHESGASLGPTPEYMPSGEPVEP
jgi:hypothetical protein